MPEHAYLSASASHRWLACPPSPVLCAQEEDHESPYAKQGTDAHGVRYPGFKLVEGKSSRKYVDEAAVAKVVSDAGYDPYEKAARHVSYIKGFE